MAAAPPARHELAALVEELCQSGLGVARPSRQCAEVQPLPSRQVVLEMVEALRSVLFPGYFGTAELSEQSMRFHVGATLDRVAQGLQEQIWRGLCFRCNDPAQVESCHDRAAQITRTFLARLPAVQRLAAADVHAAYQGDPALHSPDEAIFCYPGIRALSSYRLAHELHELGVPLLPRIITEQAHSDTGIDIHPAAVIGEELFIDHGTGIVVGETCVIGDRVRIYQGVTLGARSFPLDDQGQPVKGVPRHPIIEDEVIIYAGATILGRVTIGRGSVIGGNVWLVRSVPPESHITQVQARQELFENGAGI